MNGEIPMEGIGTFLILAGIGLFLMLAYGVLYFILRDSPKFSNISLLTLVPMMLNGWGILFVSIAYDLSFLPYIIGVMFTITAIYGLIQSFKFKDNSGQ